MSNLYIVEDSELTDITKIEEYNKEFEDTFPDWKPFVTRENFETFLKEVEEKKQGIGNNGLKEIYYWFMEDDKIIGSGGIRLNPEIDEYIDIYCGHIFYQINPSKRGKGYGTILCKKLLEKMKELGYKEVIITCYEPNIGSIRIIEKVSGKLIETVEGEKSEKHNSSKIRRYKINIK